MTARILVDANVVLYSRDQRYPEKMRQCGAWLRSLAQAGSLVISPQTAAEHQRNARRKLGESQVRAAEATRRLLPFCPMPTGMEVVARALEIEARWKLSWWDSMQVAYAREAGCTHLLSEDRQSAPVVEGVRIIDPFATAPEEVLA